MEMQDKRQLSVTQQQAWDWLNDPDVLKACIPGCERIEETAPQHFDLVMAVKLGPVAAKFRGKIVLSDVDPPHRYTLSFEGQGGAAGHGKGSAKVGLTRNDDGCELAYTVHAQVGGKLAQLGQRLVDGAAKSMAEDFFHRFDLQMQRRFPAIPQTEFMPTTFEEEVEKASAKSAPGVPAWAWIAGALGLVALVWALR